MNEWFVLCWSNVRSQAMGRGHGHSSSRRLTARELRVVRVARAGHHFTPDIVFTVLRW